MDVRNWKSALLLWISEFEYTDKSYNNVEQTDVEAFYEHIRQHHNKIDENITLLDFFQANYSAYRPHVDDQNELSSADYVYVYSLLLHFTCVKHPEAYFQEKCRKLTQTAQEAIAFFFQLMLECQLQNKENLRHIIGEVAASINQKLSPKHLSDASSSGTPSPAKTPLSKTLSRISPSTPKTILLDERTKELFNLRAELENERYEKSVLETQIKENEVKIKKLSSDCKKMQQKLLDMKNNFQEPAYDGTSASPSEAEKQSQLIRRLQRDIKQKDLEITKLTENLCGLRDEVTTLTEQVSSEKEDLKKYMERLEESDSKIFELTNELEKKHNTIKYLNEQKNELEHFIGECRSNNRSSRIDLNNSSDCLDNSFIRSNATLSPTHAPENMSSVVDMQLREKAREVQQLQQDLLSLREKGALLIKGIKEQANLISENFKVPMPNIMSFEMHTENTDALEYFQIFVLELKEVNQLYLEDLENMRTLQDKIRELCDKNAQQAGQLSEHKDRIEVLESENSDLAQDKLHLESRLSECVDEITLLLNDKKQALEHLESTREQLHKEYTSLKKANDRELLQEREFFQNQQNKLVSDIENYRLKLQESQEEIVRLNKQFKLEKEKLQEKLQQHVSNENLGKEKYEKLLIEREALKKQERHVNAHLDKMQTLLNNKEKEMLVLGEEISEVRALNTELEQRMEELSKDFKLERQETNERIAKLKERESQLLKELEFKNNCYEQQAKKISYLMSLCNLTAVENDGQMLQHLQEIERAVNGYKQKILKLREQLEHTAHEKEKLQKDLKIVIEKHNEAKVQLKQKDKSNKQLDDVLQSKAKLEEEIIEMKAKHIKELEQKHIEIGKMREQEMDLLHKLKLKAEDLEHIKSQQEARDTELSQCKQKIQGLELSLADKTQEIVELKDARELLMSKVQYFEAELRNNSQNYAKQQQQHENMLEAVENSLQLTQKKLIEKEELLCKATAKLDELEQCYNKTKLKQQQTKKQLLEKETEILEIQKLKLEADEAQKQLKQKMKKLQKDLEEQQSQVERSDATLLNILATLENAANSAMEVACPADDLDNIFNISQIENTQPHLQDLKRCLNKLVYKLTVLEQEVEQLQAKNRELLEVGNNMHSVQQATEAKTQEFSNKLLNSEQNIEKLENEVKLAAQKTQELKADLTHVFERLQKTDNEKKLLQENLAAEQAQRATYEQAVNELTNSRNALETKLTSLSELFDKCLDMKQQAEAKLSPLEESQKKLQQQLQENEEKLWKLEQEKTALAERHKQIELEKKTSQDKLSAENAKLSKRIEQLALKLGEAQARGNNLEREQKKLTETQQLALETLQSEKEKLFIENNTLKERLARGDSLQEQLATRISQLETVNGKFQLAQKQLQDDKDEIETKLQQIQRQRETQEEKLRKLNFDLEQYEQSETRLKLEVGALNSQLEVKNEVLNKWESERLEQMEKQNAQVKQMEDVIAQVAKLNMSIQERENRKDEQLENLHLQIENLKTEHEQQVKELQQEVKQLQAEKTSKLVELKSQSEELKQLLEKQEMLEEKLQKYILAVETKERELLLLRTEKDQLAEQQQLFEKQLQETEQQTEKIMENRVKQLEQEACLRQQLEAQLAEKLERCAKLEAQLKVLEKSELTHNEQLSLRLETCEDMLSKEQEANANLRTDNQILQAKYADVKQRLQEHIKLSEERIKENRLELEGKLEKMKNKMVSFGFFFV